MLIEFSEDDLPSPERRATFQDKIEVSQYARAERGIDDRLVFVERRADPEATARR